MHEQTSFPQEQVKGLACNVFHEDTRAELTESESQQQP